MVTTHPRESRVWVTARRRPSEAALAEALSAAAEVRAKETWLTHLSHEYHVDEVSKSLPPGVRMAWDGLRISLNHAPGLA